MVLLGLHHSSPGRRPEARPRQEVPSFAPCAEPLVGVAAAPIDVVLSAGCPLLGSPAYRTSRVAFWHSRSAADQASWPLGGSPQTYARWAAPCSGQGCVSCLHPAVTPGAHDASPPAYSAYPPHAHRQSLDSASQNLSRELGVEAGSDNDGGGGGGGGGGAAGEFEVRDRWVGRFVACSCGLNLVSCGTEHVQPRCGRGVVCGLFRAVCELFHQLNTIFFLFFFCEGVRAVKSARVMPES